MKEKRFTPIHMLLAVVGAVAVTLLAAALAAWLILGPEVLSLTEAWGLARKVYVGELDSKQALDSALYGLVDGLGDRWSYYLTAEGYEEQNQRRTNTYVGIGVTVDYTDQRGLKILEVREDSPAADAGLKPGELITAVDGVSVAGEARYKGAELIAGEAGTSLTVRVLSPEGESREVTLERAAVEMKLVTYELLDSGEGYIKLENFNANSAEKLNAAVDDLVEQGATALVFDMRDNGGGYVDELTAMLDHLLPEGPIFRSQSRRGQEKVVESDENYVNLSMAVLVDRDSYSAAELFAAQLQESAGAKVVGEETSGKGYSQQAIPLPNGGAMNISTARYTTGAGVSLVGTGVALDVELELTEEQRQAFRAGTLAHGEDPCLQAALELLARETEKVR